MRKYIAMLLMGFFVAGLALETYAQGCCSSRGGKTETEEVKEDTASDES